MLASAGPHSFHSSRTRALLTLLASALLLALAGCGPTDGGGGSSPGFSTVADTGAVGIFLTDSPSDDFDKILVTIREIELLCDAGHLTIFSGEQTVDLKQLEDFSDLFVYADELTTGICHKIRLIVSRVELVRGDDSVDADVPPKIDILPREPFAIRKDVAQVIELDMDAKKSIHIVGTGSGRYKFRPVIFATIRETLSPAKLARVHGVITEIFDDWSFELCSTKFMASYEDSSSSVAEGGLGDRYRCMTVEYDGDTGIFDENGDPSDTIAVEDEVTVVGRFHLVDANHDLTAQPLELGDRPHSEHNEHKYKDDDGDSDTDADSDVDSDSDSDGDGRPDHPDIQIVLLAYVIEIGPPGTFQHLFGLVESDVDGEGLFDFGIAPGQGFGDSSVVQALLQDGTRVFSRKGVEVDDSEIQTGRKAKIDGVFAASPSEALLKTALVVLDIEPVDGEELKGRIVSVEEAIRRFTMSIDDDGIPDEECVDVPTRTRILLIRRDDDGPGVEVEPGSFADLKQGLLVHVLGDFEDGSSCFVSDTILAFPDEVVCGGYDQLACDEGEVCLIEMGNCAEFAEGVCEVAPDVCPAVIQPVCGCDGNTYDNACLALKAGVVVEREGTCDVVEPVECNDNAGCDAGQFCSKPEGSCELVGVCDEIPQVCPLIIAPVCGCDGNDYGNACEANAAGVSVASVGTCDGNAAPIADAGPDQLVADGAEVTLDGSGSTDPDMDPLSFSWTQTAGPTVMLTGADTANPTFTAPAMSVTLSFELTVSDGALSDTDSVDVVVEAVSTISYANDVHPIWSARFCTSCHPNDGGLDLGGTPANSYPEVLARVNLSSPADSLILLKPLAPGAGGVGHGGGSLFADTSDPLYQTILAWITQGAPNN